MLKIKIAGGKKRRRSRGAPSKSKPGYSSVSTTDRFLHHHHLAMLAGVS
jgi:hypothetical protein